ncbi:beta strand repeat-containing protein [Hymenobacter bucti]|uniref:Ig-like domain-containing protein n=1 Tax=Hymenobacter bucti TaxID=1844114 RepID=A0ABW4QVY6_9BACT
MTNGTFSSQPGGTNIAAGNDLGGWRSNHVYAGSGVYPTEGLLAGQTGTETRAAQNISQVPFPGDPSQGVAGSNTWLHYNGQSTNQFLWIQTINLVNGATYAFSTYASNALAPTATAANKPVLGFAVSYNNGTSYAGIGATSMVEEDVLATGHNGQDLWDRYQRPLTVPGTSGTTSTILVLYDGSGNSNAPGGELALTAIAVRRINQLPRGQQTAPTVFGRQGIVALPTLRADDPDPDGSVVAYKIKVLPPASQGVLLLNGSPVRANQVLTTTEAAALSFNPNQNFSGNALFTYTATDNVGDESLDLNYGIPMDANSCNTQSVFSFASRALIEDWTTARTATIDGITITSAYTAPTLTTSTASLLVSDETGNDPGTAQPGKGLVWTADYGLDATQAAANRQSSIRFSFTDAASGATRLLNNFTLVVGDIDRGSAPGATPTNFIDRVTFTGTQANGTTVTLTAADVALAPTNSFANNAVTGTSLSGSPAGNVVLAFPVPVRDVTATYSSAQAVNDPDEQKVTILNLSWCGEADLATTISGPATAAAGQTVFYYATTTNTGPRTTSSASTTITLPGKPAANTVNVPNGTYDASTGIVTFNTTTLAPGNASVNYVSFVMPAGATSFTGQAKSSALEIDNTAANNNGTATAANVTTTVGATGAAGTVLSCPPTPGKDGTVASLTAAPNTYFLPAANAAAGQRAISLSATALSGTGAANAGTALAPGDLVLIVQMQGAAITTANDDTYGDGVAGPSANGNLTTSFTAGRYEYGVVATTSATITPGAAGTLTLRDNLTYAYTQANASGTQGQQRYQVIRIPQYTALTLGGTIAPPAWNGQLGGVLALDVAGPLNFNGQRLDASGAGFRGGAGRTLAGTAGFNNTDYRTANTSNGGKGEGTAGTPQFVATYPASGTAGTLVNTGSSYPAGDNGRGAPGTAGGGGTDAATDNSQNTGGGGGANGGRGGRGGNSWATNLAVGGEPGAAFPLASSSRLVLGGGGGAGVTNNGSGNDGTGNAFAGLASSGAPGGGIVLVRTGSVTGAGSIVANGYNADNSVDNDGSGGGGAGGSILLTAQNPNTLGSIGLAATGGTGGTNTGGGVAHGPGGGGGGGFIVSNGPTASANATAGTSGLTVGGVAFGAEAGTLGVGNPAISNSIAASAANASCVADLVSVITGPAATTAGGTVNLVVNFSNYGALPAAGLSARVSLPASLLLANISAPGATITGGVTQPYILTYSSASFSSLAAGASQSFSLSYTAPLTGTANVRADAAISTTTAEPYTVNNPSFIITNIGNYADVTTTITGPASVNPGLPTGDFTVNFTNNGPATALGITQSVTLPTGASISPAQLAALQAKYPASTVTIAYNTNTRVLSFTPTTGNNTLPSGISNTYSFPITASATPGSVVLTSNIGTSSTENASGGAGTGVQPNTATTNLTVAPLADLVASITNNNVATVAAGGTGNFVATFTNNGPSAADNVTPTVQLPTGLTNVTFLNGLVGTYNATTGLVTFPATATLASGGSLSSTIRFTMPSSQVVAAASVNTTTNEGANTANNTAIATIANSSNFDVTTTITGPPFAAPGTSVTLSVLTQNLGPGVAPSTTQTVLIPGVYTSLYVSNGGTFSNNGTNTTVTFPAVLGLASGANVNNTITLTMPAVPVNDITATVVAAGETNNITNSNAASIGSTAGTAGNVNLYATISAANYETPTTPLTGPVVPGTTLQLNITTGNYGPTAAANSVTRVDLPAGLSGVVLSNDGTYNATTGVATFPAVSSRAQGTSLNYTIVLPAPTTGPLVPVVSITSASAETVVADNVASTKVDILTLTDVTTSLSGPTAPTVGQPATYAVTTTNNGPAPAAGVVQTVQLPAGLASVALANANGTAIALPAGAYNAATGLLTLPTAAVAATQVAGASVLNYVTFTVPASTGYPVTAAVATTSQETNATNNTATLTTTPAPTADVSVTLSGPGTVAQGSLVTYIVATTNAGPSVNPSSATTVQLPTGLNNVQVSGGGSYNSSTGLVTFPALSDQAPGAAGAVGNTISFVAPTTTPLTVTAQVAVTPAGNDPNLNNNSATVNTTVTPSNTNLLDESTTIAATVGGAAVSTTNPVVAGGSVTYNLTATNTNLPNANPSVAASNVVLRLQLPAGLNAADVVLSSGSYDPATGVATFSTLGTQNSGVSNNFSATINNVPGGTTSLLATAYVSTTNSDSNPNNNVAPLTLPLAPRADVTTTISGPSTIAPNSSATYFVTTRNVGPSAASAVNTTVQLPTGLGGVVVSGGGSYDANSGLVTFPTVATLPGYSGTAAANTAAPALEYTITLTAPSTITTSAGYTLTSTVSTTTTELATQAPNTASLTTTAANQPPVASNVVNSLQAPQGNTGQQLPLSPLLATDPDGSVNSYTLSTLPTTGTLFYNNGGTYTAITSANLLGAASPLNLTPTQAQTLRYTPATGFAGNAFFSYVATDNASPALTSASALYTIPVGADNASTYANTPVKASAAAYVANDVIAFVTDNNGAVYNTSALVYNATSGTLQSGAANGVAVATSTGTFTSSQYGNVTNLSQLGLVLNAATGQIQVQTPGSLRAGTYTLNITTTDQYGGITTQPVTFVIGGTPLPVVLVEFTAQAVANRDALLNWATASEKNNDYFEVERSFDGTSFTAIAKVAGHGTTAAASAYTLTDAGVAAKATGLVYYRLRQVDRDGTSSYSPQRTLSFPKVAAVSLGLYPNPVATTTSLDLSQLPAARTYQVLLLDATGRQVRAWTLAGGQPQPLELTGLASGSYVLVVAGQQPDGSPLRQALRLTKE